MLPFPAVERVRLASLDDLHRISIVAAAAFFWSPTFQFQRPRYNKYPSDTVASYLIEYRAAIKDPTCAVLVAEDVLEENEAEDVYEALRPAYGPKPPREEGIIGVCSLSLRPNSHYVGRCQPESKLDDDERSETNMAINTEGALLEPATHSVVRDLKRDQCAAALKGVSATPKGQTIVEKAGFQEREIVRVKRLVAYEQQTCDGSSDAAEVTLWYVRILDAMHLKASTNSSTPTLGLGFAYQVEDRLPAAHGVGRSHRQIRSKRPDRCES
ncbi:hypothetical protein N0V83_006105 [Neocucurbitaria cava]|uniref:Uncharacterized protein n=1 Tax=Neocucurbitaria cava TaxID=798079 RepID=A0A9W8Y8X7_9PLEO|nr:hypothetical protein N0V83_006105 [Neocucurbitaria cava]